MHARGIGLMSMTHLLPFLVHVCAIECFKTHTPSASFYLKFK